MESPFRFLSLGPDPLDYEKVRAFQHELVEARAQEKIPDTVLFLEHRPVVTQGRGLQWTGTPRERHMPLPTLSAGIAFAESERGGDLTYHGPGQLVIYPIFKIRDVAAYLRGMEAATVRWLGGLGLKAEGRESATGVWVGDHKIASIGIAVRKWVTYHGIAINAVNDLKPFHLISPCGFSPEVMTNLSLTDVGASMSSEWRAWMEQGLALEFAREFHPESLQAMQAESAKSTMLTKSKVSGRSESVPVIERVSLEQAIEELSALGETS